MTHTESPSCTSSPVAWSDPLLPGTELCSGRGTCPGGRGQAWTGAGVPRRQGRSVTGRRPPPKEAWTGRPCPSVGSREHVSNSRSFSLCVELNLPIKELLTPPLGSAGMRTREQQRGHRLGAGRRPSLLGVTHRGETSARRAEAATGRHPRPRGLKHRDARPHLWTREAQGRLLPGPPSFPCVSLTELYLHSDEEARDSCGASSPEWTRPEAGACWRGERALRACSHAAEGPPALGGQASPQ